MNIDRHVSDYYASVEEIDKQDRELQSRLKCFRKYKHDRCSKFDSSSIIIKLLAFIWHKLALWRLQCDIEVVESKIASIQEKHVDAKKHLIVECARVFMLENCGDKLAEFEREHQTLKKAFSSIEQIKIAGDNTISAIESAISEIDDAQIMEVVDGITDSKGISVISTLSNWSASHAVGRARTAINGFQKRLEESRQIFTSTDFSLSTEIMDLAIDVFFAGIMDSIGSALSFCALKDAESKLDNALSEVRNALLPISDKYKQIGSKLSEHEAALLEFKCDGRLAVIPLIQRKGVPVGKELVREIELLYAPSAI